MAQRRSLLWEGPVLSDPSLVASSTEEKTTVKTVGELMKALSTKNPEGEIDILVQNNPERATYPHALPEKVVVLVADGDFIRLN